MITHKLKACTLEFVHLIWHLYNQFNYILLTLYYILLNLLQYDTPKKDLDLRIPKHIAMTFTNESTRLDMDSIARLLCWCKELGIDEITLYDDMGQLKRRENDLYRCLEFRMSLLGYTKPISFIRGLRVLSQSDGRKKFFNDIRILLATEPDNIDIDLVQAQVGWRTDPELLINFGSPLCLHGFPPWQLRLTEILSIPTHRNLPYKIFKDCLDRYSKITQRIGA